MAKRKYFGTDGIRGEFGSETMCPHFARAVGVAVGRYMKESQLKAPLSVLIGRDTRGNGPALVEALAEGLASEGVESIDAGVAPTPAIALSIPQSGAGMGIAVTASHNPASDNGIKLFDAAALKLPDSVEQCIEGHIDAALGSLTEYPEASLRPFDAAALYRRKMSTVLPAKSLSGWKIAVDTAHGAATFTTGAVLSSLGAEVVAIGSGPDGQNINDGVGSEHPDGLRRLVLDSGASIGIANDGDADRVVLCDEKGELVDGDEVLCMIGLHLHAKGKLAENTLVATIMSNYGLDEAMNKAGARVERVNVGDRYILESMVCNGFNFGGEASGHIIFKDISTTGDGLMAALQVIAIMLESGKPLSELRKVMPIWPQEKKNIPLKAKVPFEQIEGWERQVKDIEQGLGQEGRVLVRYSGTEPKIRLLAEAKEAEDARKALAALEELVSTHLELA